MWGNQENMDIQYSNTVINILRITQTHVLTVVGQLWSESAGGLSDAPPLAHDLVPRY